LALRLTHIKIAGFKSFVDPTHIALPGQLVGVVGPNGCGKSNVIDAVRWVLGESSAKHLRGETMQDVIFNGSGQRKPVNRASVELVFDNSLGKASGPWSRYTEISIRRVLERQGDSTYYINNIAVRRRDVADIFLGTGLGARAYAIIEQGMISRIVDARPEELRVFLEEAAGVSKYRERRRETENRLEDTRENLLRVEDIRRELETQVTRLEEQAAAAERYRSLEADIQRSQCLLWTMRRREAGALRTRLAGELDQTATDLDVATTALRSTEAALETARVAHYAAGDALHEAQGALYEVNAEFSRIEQQLQFARANRNRGEARKRELEDLIVRELGRAGEVRATAQSVDGELEFARERAEESALTVEACRDALPEANERQRCARTELEQVRAAIGGAQRDAELARTRRDQSERLLRQWQTREERLHADLSAIQAPEDEEVALLRQEHESLEGQMAGLSEQQESLRQRQPVLETAFRDATRVVDAARTRLASLEARRQALVGLQQQVGASEQMSGWLGQHGLDRAARLWERVEVASGWEDAVEAVLRERLNAVALDDPSRLQDWFGASPPGKLAMVRPGLAGSQESGVVPVGCRAIGELVTPRDPGAGAAVQEWLWGVWAAPSAAVALAASQALRWGEIVVCPEGHVFTAHSIGFHAPDSEIHGLLERKREIETLERTLPDVEDELLRHRAAASAAEQELADCRARVEALRAELARLAQRRHEAGLAHLRAAQQADRARERREQIRRELDEIVLERDRELAALDEAGQDLERAQDAGLALGEALERAQSRFAEAEAGLASARERISAAERDAQEAQFEVRGLEARLRELQRSAASIDDSLARARQSLEQAQGDLAAVDEAPLEAQLGSILERRQARETALGAGRDALAEAERRLRELDEQRAGLQRRLDPLQGRIGDLRLKEQEARLAEENFARLLEEARADEQALASLLEKAPRPGTLQSDINRLQAELAALGAVNLAALEELRKTTERKAFLDAQSADLAEAVATLEDAIRRIDRQTRELLKGTFDQVNTYLGEMFPQLFGGGEARLVMTGEEILDAGVQIIARPPGKKNASIHLLSGGEKALTAVSLVFSMFRLNPAPFCLLDEVDAPLDDSNTGRFCQLVRRMSDHTQFIFISHNKITMELAEQLIGVTMPESGVSRVVAVDIEEALRMREDQAA
jgi:chromosome segregation protein